MSYKVFIDGHEGTTGLRIVDRLSARKDIEIININEENRKNIEARAEKINQADISFLCLPDAASIEIVSVIPKTAKILDTSTAHRTNPEWVYGLPELSPEQKSNIQHSNRVAVPGCHATGFIVLTKPMVASGLCAADYPFFCESITGYSGGGKKTIAAYHEEGRSEELSSPRQYGLTQQHKHLKEMKAMTGIEFNPIFTPVINDFYNGMLVTVPIHTRFLKTKASAADIHKLFKNYYKGSKLVKVADFGFELELGFLTANTLADKDNLQLFIYGNEEQVLLTARYDNLGKGASGAAIQCMNIMLGLPEEEGLVI
ncbi:N-acetyl-gamma-glutamyl-phosphate reductase [Clostridium aminobutyricum]|uniref:N-acetyl-gamma-glutamyl-phosphate reductase n=1 Tax=Clostridium aminobutyricum TaxID=33953 RepID=A0A939IGM5_CLOAM|nr:N-acetyl-gamma-glutamyl-phosphate reductase [Clostridium aminobutyricum]MBN7772152.1 N-acetyl-gamma-glutamyl-phosphate reductase [Clostridium aminobutyricum]